MAFIINAALLASAASKPNFLLINADDLGYGDLQCTGHPSSLTPRIDRMAREGTQFRDFYTAHSVCTPSRGALLTGRYAPRLGIYEKDPCARSAACAAHFCAFLPEDLSALPHNETTIAEALRSLGYATGMSGKWHLGIGLNGSSLPVHHGFDSYYGWPATHDDCRSSPELPPTSDPEQGPCAEYRNATVALQPADLWTCDERYVADAQRFISAAVSSSRPWFYYFASHHTHMPQFAPPHLQNATARGAFGDSLLTLDGSVGALLDHVTSLGIERQTLAWLTSDNGPQLHDLDLSGSPGPFKCGKGTYYEGGLRVPSVAWWPGTVAADAISHELLSTLDFLPTFVSLATAEQGEEGLLASGPVLDGVDVSAALHGGISPREEFFYWNGAELWAARVGNYKLHFRTQGSHCAAGHWPDPDCWSGKPPVTHSPPLLFHLQRDPMERRPLNGSDAADAAGAAWVQRAVTAHLATMVIGASVCDAGADPRAFPCCQGTCEPHQPACCACTVAA